MQDLVDVNGSVVVIVCKIVDVNVIDEVVTVEVDVCVIMDVTVGKIWIGFLLLLSNCEMRLFIPENFSCDLFPLPNRSTGPRASASGNESPV